MDRREYLLAATAVTAGVAGCSTLQSGNGDDDSDDEGPAVPEWTAWIPARALAPGSEKSAFALDIQRSRAELPPSTNEAFNIPNIAQAFGIEQSQMGYMVGLQTRPGDIEFAIITGTFSEDAMFEQFDISESSVEEYRGYAIVSENVAIADGAAATGPDYREAIDAKTGATDALHGSDEWRPLLAEGTGDTIFGVKRGFFTDLPFSVEQSANAINAADDDMLQATSYLVFESPERASAVREEYRQEIVAAVTGTSEATVESVEQQNNRIVVVAKTEGFTGFGGGSTV